MFIKQHINQHLEFLKNHRLIRHGGQQIDLNNHIILNVIFFAVNCY